MNKKRLSKKEKDAVKKEITEFVDRKMNRKIGSFEGHDFILLDVIQSDELSAK